MKRRMPVVLGGFTLLELIVVIIILGILATIGFVQYTRMVEKGRVGEAKAVLGTIRTAEISYQLENPGNWGSLAQIGMSALPTAAAGACAGAEAPRYDFGYSVDTGAGTATAMRCTSGGKSAGSSAYTVVINFSNGTITGGP